MKSIHVFFDYITTPTMSTLSLCCKTFLFNELRFPGRFYNHRYFTHLRSKPRKRKKLVTRKVGPKSGVLNSFKRYLDGMFSIYKR